MNQGRAKSIFSCAQPFSITIIVSGLRCMTGTAGSAARRTRVNGSECDCLSPPVRVFAGLEEVVDELVLEVAGLDEAAAKLGDRVDPVRGPR